MGNVDTLHAYTLFKSFLYQSSDKQLLKRQLEKIIQEKVEDRDEVIKSLLEKIWDYSSDDKKQRLWNVYERSSELDQVILKALMDGMSKPGENKSGDGKAWEPNSAP